MNLWGKREDCGHDHDDDDQTHTTEETERG